MTPVCHSLRPSNFHRRLLLALCAFLVPLPATVTQAQMVTTTITSSGLGTNVSTSGTTTTITGGTRPENGGNLFHSFGSFSVGAPDTANFFNITGFPTTNILSRVTGGEVSNIFGALKTTDFGNAALWLINPAGIVFGPTASLNVGGALHVSTADYLRMFDGMTSSFFHADLSKNSQLTSAPVETFGFLSNTPTPITVQGSTLGVPAGQTLSFVGGDLMIRGNPQQIALGIPTVDTPNGRINIASVASSGEVVIGPVAQGQGLQMQEFTQLGSIGIEPGTFFNTSGNPGGTMVIRGGRLTVEGATFFSNTLGDQNGAPLALDMQITGDVIFTNGAFVFANLVGGGQAGEIQLSGKTVEINNGAILSANTIGAGNGGNITIQAQSLTVTDGAKVMNNTLGSGQGGNLSVTATESIQIQGRGSGGSLSGLFSNVQFGSGDAGNLSIKSPVVNIGEGGAIVGNSLSSSTGNAGDVLLEVNRLQLTNGGEINTSTMSQGTGGSLTIWGMNGPDSNSELVLISETGMSNRPSALIANALGIGLNAGNAKEITIQAEFLQVEKGGRITSRTEGDGNAGNIGLHVGRLDVTEGGQIFSGTGTLVNGIPTGSGGPGKGGSLRVTATESIRIQGRDSGGSLSGLFSNAQFGSGDAGNLSIKSPIVNIGEGGAIVGNSLSSSTGNAGDVFLEVNRLQLTNGGEINTSTLSQGTGGTLTIWGMNGPDSNSELVLISETGMSNRPSALIANALGIGLNAGNAKEITIQAEFLQVEKGGRITSRTEGDGNAGNIGLHVGRLDVTEGGQIFSGTGTLKNGSFTGTGGPGKGGTVSVNASESINIVGQDQKGFKSGLFSNAQFGSGDAGDLTISTTSLTLNGGLILASSGIASSGKAGSIGIDAETTSLINSGTISVESSGGGGSGAITLNNSETLLSDGGTITAKVSIGEEPGGSITISAGQNILLTNGAQITAESLGMGIAGNITLTANDTILIKTGTVTTRATLASGGNIKLNANENIHLIDSTIESSVQGDAQTQGGNIGLDPDFIIMQNSQVLAKANEGAGGRIDLVGNVVFVDPLSFLDASAGPAGVDGSVNIQAPIKNLSGTIAPLPGAIVEVASLYSANCAGQKGGAFSSFTVQGRDRIPLEPGELLPTPLIMLPDSTQELTPISRLSTMPMATRLHLPGLAENPGTESIGTIFGGGCHS